MPHAIVVLPKTDGMEMLLCYEDEGVYVNTYGRITKDVVLQWGEMPTSVGMFTHVNFWFDLSVDFINTESIKSYGEALMNQQTCNQRG